MIAPDPNEVLSLADIEENHTLRLTTGHVPIDTLFGTSRRYNEQFEIIKEESGLARGSLMLLAGEEGIRTTQFYTALAIRMVQLGLKVLVFQGETTLEFYKELVSNMCRALRFNFTQELQRSFHVSEHRQLHEQVKLIREVSPDFAVVDTFNMIEGATRNDGIEAIVREWKHAIAGFTPALFVAHLDENKKIWGNPLIERLVDAYYLMQNEPLRGSQISSITTVKSRVGPIGRIHLSHEDGIVKVWDQEPPLLSTVPQAQ